VSREVIKLNDWFTLKLVVASETLKYSNHDFEQFRKEI